MTKISGGFSEESDHSAIFRSDLSANAIVGINQFLRGLDGVDMQHFLLQEELRILAQELPNKTFRVSNRMRLHFSLVIFKKSEKFCRRVPEHLLVVTLI